MATTYGYGGEFSSDEDIDRMEQQTERLQSKFDTFAPQKPTRHQIEEAIESIRKLPLDQDVLISDEIIAGLLDYYKTQRGPIVDSTRNLYKKIILKLIREGYPQASNGDAKDNGSNTKQRAEATGSSDEDEPMASASQSSIEGPRKFDSLVIQDDNLEPMEVDIEDSAQQRLAIRNKKATDLSESDEDSETEESSDDSEVVDVTPVKDSPQAVVPKAASVTPAAAQKALESAKKPNKIKESTTTEASKKKPYTRSQRQAANKSSTPSKEEKKIDSSSKEASSSGSSKVLSKSSLTSYENFSRSLRKIRIDEPSKLNLMENENNEIVFEGTTINGRKLNYAEKMVLTAMIKHKHPLKNRRPSGNSRDDGGKPF